MGWEGGRAGGRAGGRCNALQLLSESPCRSQLIRSLLGAWAARVGRGKGGRAGSARGCLPRRCVAGGQETGLGSLGRSCLLARSSLPNPGLHGLIPLLAPAPGPASSPPRSRPHGVRGPQRGGQLPGLQPLQRVHRGHRVGGQDGGRAGGWPADTSPRAGCFCPLSQPLAPAGADSCRWPAAPPLLSCPFRQTCAPKQIPDKRCWPAAAVPRCAAQPPLCRAVAQVALWDLRNLSRHLHVFEQHTEEVFQVGQRSRGPTRGQRGRVAGARVTRIACT